MFELQLTDGSQPGTASLRGEGPLNHIRSDEDLLPVKTNGAIADLSGGRNELTTTNLEMVRTTCLRLLILYSARSLKFLSFLQPSSGTASLYGEDLSSDWDGLDKDLRRVRANGAMTASDEIFEVGSMIAKTEEVREQPL